MLHAALVEVLCKQSCHALPLAENHHFAIARLQHLVDNVHGFAYFHVVAGGLVEHIGAVAHHTHYVETQQQSAAVRFAQKVLMVPFVYQASHCFLIFLMDVHLLRCHSHEHGHILAFGQLKRHIHLAAANEAFCGLPAHAIEILVAHHFCSAVGDYAIVAKLVVWPKAILVDKFHHRIEFFNLIFERCTRQRHHVMRIDAPCGCGYDGIPIFQTLHFVHNHHIHRYVSQVAHIVGHRVIGNYLVGAGHAIHMRTLGGIAFHYQHIGSGKAFYLALPLIFERRWTHHEHRLGKVVVTKQLGGADGLHRLAETHLVGYQRAALGEGKFHAIFLIRKQFGVEQMVKFFIAHILSYIIAAVGLTHLYHIAESIVVASKSAADGACSLQKLRKSVVAIAAQHAGVVEISLSESLKLLAAFIAEANAHLALVAIRQIDRCIRW